MARNVAYPVLLTVTDAIGQTFEGGIGSVPDAEAHGSYTFCALACLCLLGDPHEVMHKYGAKQ